MHNKSAAKTRTRQTQKPSLLIEKMHEEEGSHKGDMLTSPKSSIAGSVL